MSKDKYNFLKDCWGMLLIAVVGISAVLCGLDGKVAATTIAGITTFAGVKIIQLRRNNHGF